MEWIWLPLAEMGLGTLSRALTDRAAGYAFGLALLHPLAIGAMVGMSLDAAVRATGRGSVAWRSRRYNIKDAA